MTELLTAAQMRAIETAAIDSGEVTGLELMERAGAGVVETVFEEWPELGEGVHRAVVLCGPGNNGGDGFVVARLLKERGWEVEVFLYGDPAKLPPDAKTNYERWGEMGAVDAFPEETCGDFPSRFSLHQEPELVVDALFGTGLTRHLSVGTSKALSDLSSVFPSAFTRWIAVDMPSGLCSDSGRLLMSGEESSHTNRYSLTVTFHTEKVGHRISDGPAVCGYVSQVDIGLKRDRLVIATVNGSRAGRPRTVHLIGGPGQRVSKSIGHKYTHGHALILSGGTGRTSAARLAARGALRIGAGLVTLGVPGSAQQEVACQITALMLRRVDDGAGLAEVLQDGRLNALCLGPGLGVDRARELVPQALRAPDRDSGAHAGGGPGSSPGRAVVLDADALTAYQDDPATLFSMLHESCVLTPHAGEFRRLFPDIAAKLDAPATKGPAYSKVDATREAAARAGCVVLFKGPDTVIAAPDGQCNVNAAVYDRAAPWLATAGSGDVLAGFITGLLARGFAPMQAAETAAWLHVECARRFGPGLIAEDLPEELPKVFRDLDL
ncbi:MAG: NAD(P)H-hydrate dehydratase [Paracoccaceae bacterium]|nr:NAD(P)H-hydrate dehydratase [Paracoccaceae bacterium]